MADRNIPVFVYGTLKAGFGNHRRLLHGAEFIGKAVTVQPFLMKDNGGFPVVFRSNAEVHNVSGEVYEVTEQTLKSLDSLEGHPEWYRREEVIVDIGDTGIQQSAWMYIGVPQAWARSLPQLATCPVDASGAYVWGSHA